MKTTLQNSMRPAFSSLIMLILMIPNLQAQDYLISYAGAGASTSVDSVMIENLMQGTTLKMKGTEVLRLTVVTGIEAMNEDESGMVRFYPNPMKDHAKMQFILPEPGETIITLYDISGRKISQRNDLLTRGRHVYVIQGIEGGIYLAKVTSGRYSCSGRLISSGSGGGAPEIAYEHTLSLNEKPEGIKGTTVEKTMQYNTGDRLKLKGISGIYSTVITDVPTAGKTISFNFIPCTDGDGNNYSVVQIGSAKGDSDSKAVQTWTVENLRTTKLSNGTPINFVDSKAEWWTYTTPAYCYYGNNSKYAKDYGGLYNGYAAESYRLCPVGWHVPGQQEWTLMVNYLGGASGAGGKLKETGSVHWGSITIGANNETGFTGIPGGSRDSQFRGIGDFAYWWTKTQPQTSPGSLYNFYLWNGDDIAHFSQAGRGERGYSVRCVQDW